MKQLTIALMAALMSFTSQAQTAATILSTGSTSTTVNIDGVQYPRGTMLDAIQTGTDTLVRLYKLNTVTGAVERYAGYKTASLYTIDGITAGSYAALRTWLDANFEPLAGGGGGSPTGTAAGDLAGTYPNPTIKGSVHLSGTPQTPNLLLNANSLQIANKAYVLSQIQTLSGTWEITPNGIDYTFTTTVPAGYTYVTGGLINIFDPTRGGGIHSTLNITGTTLTATIWVDGNDGGGISPLFTLTAATPVLPTINYTLSK